MTGAEILLLILAIMAVAKVVVNLTPSEKDNKVFEWIDTLVDLIIPNIKVKGKKLSVHKTNLFKSIINFGKTK